MSRFRAKCVQRVEIATRDEFNTYSDPMVREAIMGEFNAGEYGKDAFTGATSGAMVGAIGGGGVLSAPGAAVGAAGGAAINVGSHAIKDAWYQWGVNDNQRAGWQAGDVEESLNSIKPLLERISPQVATLLTTLGQQYAQFVAGKIEQKQGVDIGKNVFNPEYQQQMLSQAQQQQAPQTPADPSAEPNPTDSSMQPPVTSVRRRFRTVEAEGYVPYSDSADESYGRYSPDQLDPLMQYMQDNGGIDQDDHYNFFKDGRNLADLAAMPAIYPAEHLARPLWMNSENIPQALKNDVNLPRRLAPLAPHNQANYIPKNSITRGPMTVVSDPVSGTTRYLVGDPQEVAQKGFNQAREGFMANGASAETAQAMAEDSMKHLMFGDAATAGETGMKPFAEALFGATKPIAALTPGTEGLAPAAEQALLAGAKSEGTSGFNAALGGLLKAAPGGIYNLAKGMGLGLIGQVAGSKLWDAGSNALQGGDAGVVKNTLGDVTRMISEVNRLSKNDPHVLAAGQQLEYYMNQILSTLSPPRAASRSRFRKVTNLV